VHQNGRIVSVATIIAVGVNNDGRREILGLDIGPSGAETFCTEFLRKLRRRGLRGVKLVVLDATKASMPRIEGADHQLATLPASTSCAMRSPTQGKSGRRVVSAFIVTAFAQDDPEQPGCNGAKSPTSCDPRSQKKSQADERGRAGCAGIHELSNLATKPPSGVSSATLPAFCCLHTVLAGHGWSCTKADVRRPIPNL
jgi:hypothetical protein